MKKALRILLILCLLTANVFLLASCTGYGMNEDTYYDIGVNTRKNKAFVARIHVEKGDPTDIVLPDTYEGVPVVALGGVFGRGMPCVFDVEISAGSFYPDADRYFDTLTEYLDTAPDMIGDAYEVEEIFFTVTLPAGLQEAKRVNAYVSCAEYDNGDGTTYVKVLRPRISFSISEENGYFYTKNGKLYDKKTDELIEDLNY